MGVVWKSGGPAVRLSSASKAGPVAGVEERKAVPAVTPAKPKPHADDSANTNREAKKYERGVNWVFQDFERNSNLLLAESECGMMKGVMLDHLIDCTVQIQGKVKNILVTQCRKVVIQCQSVVASTEIVGCKGVKIQTLGLMPSLAIDGSDGVQVYLNEQSKRECVIATSKSCDMTVNVPSSDASGDWVEVPIPHQFVHRFTDGRLNSAVSDLYH